MNKFWNFTDNDDGSRTLMLCGSIADESWYDDDITPKAFREELNAGKRVQPRDNLKQGYF